MRMYTLNGYMGYESQGEVVGVYKSIAQARVASKKVRDNYYEMTIERLEVDAPALDYEKGEEPVVVEIL